MMGGERGRNVENVGGADVSLPFTLWWYNLLNQFV